MAREKQQKSTQEDLLKVATTASQEALEPQPEVAVAQSADAAAANAELLNLQRELEETKDLYLRKAAEFENYRRRTQQEFKNLISAAAEAMIYDLLPVLDDLDRLLANREGNCETLLRGAQLIRDKLWEQFAARGLTPIETEGAPFDPELHEALIQQQDGAVEPGMVLQEHLRGYRLGEKVLRHAQVIVSG